MTGFELAGLNVKANPKYGSEKKGQPTTFYGVLSREPLRLNGELQFVNIVLSPDPNAFNNSNPLAGLQPGGVFVIQSEHEPAALWASLPPQARQVIQENDIKVYSVDAFKIATEEATDPDLRYRMQGTAFMGAFFRTSPFMEAEGLDEETLFEGMRKQLEKKFGHLGERVVEANLKVIRRGFDEVRTVTVQGELVGAGQVMAEAAVGQIPTLLDHPDQDWGIANQGRFWEQVCSLCGLDQDVIADPFAAISAIPAATSTVRDMSDIRFEIPEFIAAKCTGCSQCWTQCPDAAIPGLVNSVEDVIQAAIRTAQNGKPLDRIQSVSANLAREARKVLKAVPFQTFGDTVSTAYGNLAEKLPWDAERKKELDEEFAAVYSVLADFPLAKTVPFFDQHENKEKGAGGLLSITVNPEACKGCNICVDVCADGALVTVHQNEENLDQLRRNWKLWENLPDTADRFINIRNLEEGIGVLPSLLLKKENYRTMAGGDGACMGCGEKTAVHLIVSAVESLMQPRVESFVANIEELIETLDGQARELLSADADLDLAALADGQAAEVPLDDEKRAQLKLYTDTIAALKDLLWRYTKGPSGQGRANMGISNSTGCSSVWGSTFPYNPYPYPWVNHLFQDSPSVAIGIFEGHMRKMGDGFTAVRRARLLASGEYDADLSRLLASGKPVRVVVLDTQVYSNTGGQACTSGFIGQVSDMAAYGKAQHGKEETRKELAMIALAHRGAFVLQSSQASASHMIGGVIRALKSPRPSVMNIYTPCPVEHGLADEWAPNASRFALEGRAFPFLIFDPDAGATIADCLDLAGNPDLDQTWPTYELEYVDEDGQAQKMELPVTTADWAATEGRFKKHFKRIKPEEWNEDQVLFHEFIDLSEDERVGKTPFIWVIDGEKKLGRLACSMEMVLLGEDRLLYWSQLRELAGLEVPASVRADIADDMEAEFEAKAAAIRTDYEAQLAELRMSYPALVARRMAEGLLASGDGNLTVAEILARANADPDLRPITAEAVAGLAGGLGVDVGGGNGGATVTVAPAEAVTRAVAIAEAAEVTGVSVAPAVAEPEAADDDDDALVMDPYIETARCTSCDECININKKLFAYDENKQAYIKDKNAGTFAEIVQGAERCTAGIIHPGTPVNMKEKDIEKWIERAKPFN
jgi:pyruvate-ferredoxin/flavodoxin oxidoreductase